MKITDGLHAFPWTSMSANNCNTYLIDGPAKILIDPGHLSFFPHVAAQLNALGIDIGDIDLIVATHGHPDHFEAARYFKNQPALFAVGFEDWQLIRRRLEQAGPASGLEDYTPDFFLGPGSLTVKGVELTVVACPGHSPGSVALYWPERKALFPGDVIFRDGLGRTDLPGGNGAVLKKSIRELATLDSELLLPGHGDIVRGADQVRANFKRVESYWFNYI
ncbi:MAG: MBL fold metallo-hydrolase [Syntrophobacteraceae bacterium]|nr:MBL fold metallo-hydrolase [Syntrophobacteraceae bacterium]